MAKQYNKLKSAAHVKRINDAGLNVEANNMYNSTMLRDQNFDLNQNMMFKAERNLEFSYKLGMVLTIFTAFFSFVWFFHNVMRVLAMPMANAAAQMKADIYGRGSLFREEHIEWMTSGCLVLFPFGVLGIVMNILANKMINNKFTRFLYLSYFATAAVGISNFFSVWDDLCYMKGMNVFFGTLLSLIGFTGILLSNHTHDAIKDIEYLVTQEGFPTFNSAMFYMHRSKFVKYREKWEAKHKTAADYKAIEHSTEKMVVTAPADPDRMDGVGVHADDIETELVKREMDTAERKEPPRGVMDELITEGAHSEEYDYQVNDTKNKVLEL